MGVLTERQQELLHALVQEYVKTAQPVGSASLAGYGFGVSSATIRNELAVLEEEGYIAQPHTSAGRVPLEKGFRFVVADLMEKKEFLKKPAPAIQRPEATGDAESMTKRVARDLAETAGGAVIVSFGPRRVYTTGFSELMNQPEFEEYEQMLQMAQLIDHMDEVVGDVFSRATPEISIWIGSENPWSPACAAVVTRYSMRSADGIIGLLGPLRMNYERNYSLLKIAKETLEELV